MDTRRLDKEAKELYELGDLLFRNPELGYKEHKTVQILKEYFAGNGIETVDLGYETAFKASIGSGRPYIGLIAELDAIPTLGHRFASRTDNAAHSCGHSTQCAIMAFTLVRLKDVVKKGTVTLYFTPGEEFTDIAYRRKLIREGKIDYIGGKVNMLTGGCFDKEDLFIHLHAMGESDYHFSLNSSLSGFIYKQITFTGRAAHAAVLPHEGINALNAFVLFDSALNMLRETFREKDHIRVHGVLSEGGQTVNSIPERTIYECYVRSIDQEALIATAEKVDNAARYCARAIGAKASIFSMPGYLPMHQSGAINDIIKKYMLKYCDAAAIHDGEISMAAGDIGDLSCFKPTVQFGYSGFGGRCHGKDLCILDENRAYLEPAKIVYETVCHLLSHPEQAEKIAADFRPLMDMDSYKEYLK